MSRHSPAQIPMQRRTFKVHSIGGLKVRGKLCGGKEPTFDPWVLPDGFYFRRMSRLVLVYELQAMRLRAGCDPCGVGSHE